MSHGTYPTLPPSPIGFGDLVSATLKLFSRHWWQYLLLALIPSVVVTIVSALCVLVWVFTLAPSMMGSRVDLPGLIATLGVSVLVILVISALATLYCSSVAIGLAEGSAWGETRTWGRAAARVRGVIGRVGWVQALLAVVASLALVGILASLLVPMFRILDSGGSPTETQLGVFVGAVLLFVVLALLSIPVVLVLQTKFAFVLPVAALEHDRRGFSVYARSWQMTRGHFWRILGYMLLAGVITQALLALTNQLIGVFYSPFEAMFDTSGEYVGLSAVGWVVSLLAQLLNMVLAAAVSMVLTLFSFVLYIDADRRNRGEVTQPFMAAPLAGPHQG